MSRLIHRTAPGFTYFVTTKTWQSRTIFQVTENAGTLIECIVRHRDKGIYSLHEFVVMPNHLHLILTPSEQTTLEKAMQMIKGGGSHDIHEGRQSKMPIWQPGFHEESIRDFADYKRKADYIRMNPVAGRLVDKPEAWAYSSAAGRVVLDALPERLSLKTSGAKAPFTASSNVGAKAPTP
jgi:putative transposase